MQTNECYAADLLNESAKKIHKTASNSLVTQWEISVATAVISQL